MVHRFNPPAVSLLAVLRVMLVLLVARSLSIPMVAGVPTVEVPSLARISLRSIVLLLIPHAGSVCSVLRVPKKKFPDMLCLKPSPLLLLVSLAVHLSSSLTLLVSPNRCRFTSTLMALARGPMRSLSRSSARTGISDLVSSVSYLIKVFWFDIDAVTSA